MTSSSTRLPALHPRASADASVSFEVEGSVGVEVSAEPRRRVELRSPTVLRRHAEISEAWMPNRSSRKRIWDVWSKVSDEM